jgi:hypothetical protein
MERILPGSKVLARSAFGDLLPRRAVTGVVMGRDFQVVLVCSEEEWEAAEAEGREPDGIAWPAEDVSLTEHAHA